MQRNGRRAKFRWQTVVWLHTRGLYDHIFYMYGLRIIHCSETVVLSTFGLAVIQQTTFEQWWLSELFCAVLHNHISSCSWSAAFCYRIIVRLSFPYVFFMCFFMVVVSWLSVSAPLVAFLQNDLLWVNWDVGMHLTDLSSPRKSPLLIEHSACKNAALSHTCM